MKRKIILLQVLLTIILSILCGFALFGCGKNKSQVPEVKNVSITAADGVSYGKAGALHQVTYTVPEGSKVATSVKLGDAMATVADYSCLNGEYVFYTAGEYTVTVYASKNGLLGQASTKITVTDGGVFVSDVKVSAASGETLGRVGALHILTYAAEAGSDIQIEIKKGEEPATDVEFNGEYNTVVFHSAGQYTIKVTATLGEAQDSAEALIEVGVADEPSVSLSIDKDEVEEDEAVTLNHSVTYAKGDWCEGESVYALYRAATGEFREANSDEYTVIGDTFTPHAAGEWKIVYRAQGKGGAVGEATALLKCDPAEILLSLKTQERQRIRTENPTDIDYLVTGAADKYDVTYDLHGKSKIEAEKGRGNSVRITAADVDYFTVTVVYTHKADTSIQKKIDIELYSVESLAYAPVWGADPFDGLPSEVLTSMGHLLYFNAAACALHDSEITYQNVMFEVQNASITSGGVASIMYAADDENYPYVIVSNFDNNSATGSFALKMTITDPVTGYSAVAIKDFTVIPTYKNTGVIRDYVRNKPFYRIDQLNFDNATAWSSENMVLTKTGAIAQRRNATDFEPGDFAHADFDSPAKNCRFEFKFNLLGANPQTGEVWLGIGVRTATQNGGWAGFFDLHLVGGKLDITNGLETAVNTEYAFDAERPAALSGATMYVRIDRRVNGNLAEYTVYGKTEETASFEQYYRCTYAVSTSAGNAGAPVKQYQFTHRNYGGCYSVEEVSLTNYDA